MKPPLLLPFFILLLASLSSLAAEPTESRIWKSKSGHSLTATALKVDGRVVHFERANGKVTKVPLEKLSAEDQEFLRKHFKEEEKEAPHNDEPPADLGYELGKFTKNLDCGNGAHCFLYLPKSLVKSKKYPVLYLMAPHGRNKKQASLYIPGAERNRWIIAMSVESKNGNQNSMDAIQAMVHFVNDELPVDTGRQYATGMSGGSRRAFHTSEAFSEITGVIACGAGGSIGSQKQVVYGLCGTNCYNRNDMAHSFKKIKHKGSVLRYFVGLHVWPSAEMLEDAMTHLNGVFLAKHNSRYKDEYKHYAEQVADLITANENKKPQRAYMWADFMQKYKIEHPVRDKALRSLGADESNQMFVDGLYGIREFAENEFGKNRGSGWKADPQISAACIKEADKYKGHYWATILKKMSEDAQKF